MKNSAMMNALEWSKLNLNCITCCFEYTALRGTPSLMYYQVRGDGRIALVSEHFPSSGRRGFKTLSVRNTKFMNTPHPYPLPTPSTTTTSSHPPHDLCEIIIHYLMLKHS
jgi:hypothetical protein